MRILRAAGFPLSELAQTFTAGYEGYVVPVNVDEAALEHIIDAWDIDLGRSFVALEEGERIGVANLAVRGDRGWIGGLAVVPKARRRGVGRELMEAVLAVAPDRVTLEVIEQNEPAARLYENLGFERTRILEVWTLKDAPLVTANSVDPSPLGQSDVPWQRADGSLPEQYERLELDGGAILVKGGNVLQLSASDPDVAASLLSRGRDLHYVNVPEGDPASFALRALGGTLDLRQYEMELRTTRSSAPTG
jgi:GNAT superfamily N-acetyltransferase